MKNQKDRNGQRKAEKSNKGPNRATKGKETTNAKQALKKIKRGCGNYV